MLYYDEKIVVPYRDYWRDIELWQTKKPEREIGSSVTLVYILSIKSRKTTKNIQKKKKKYAIYCS